MTEYECVRWRMHSSRYSAIEEQVSSTQLVIGVLLETSRKIEVDVEMRRSLIGRQQGDHDACTILVPFFVLNLLTFYPTLFMLSSPTRQFPRISQLYFVVITLSLPSIRCCISTVHYLVLPLNCFHFYYCSARIKILYCTVHFLSRLFFQIFILQQSIL